VAEAGSAISTSKSRPGTGAAAWRERRRRRVVGPIDYI
jgi:hypothetical protein